MGGQTLNLTNTYTKACAFDYKAYQDFLIKAGAVFDSSTSTYSFSKGTYDGKTEMIPGGGTATVRMFCDGHAAKLAASTAAIAAITLALY